MRITVLLALGFLLSTSLAFAESKASVKLNNNVSGSSTSQINSETNIRVETNGEVATYSSKEPGNVEVNSVNGKSEIKVNGVLVSSSPNEPTSEPTASPTAKPTQEPGNKNILEVFEEIFKKLFSFFG
ncbi:MAG: hypothetical protein HY426_04570 [Candidatus Levybacteria bacterium]|nr:hypothetical protein [Candidatus Levybacteria bacterium]